jgi:hypothetical protein
MTLTHPWFLLGLFALAIPIILHLYELRRPQKVLFTNVDFIREVKLVTAKQRKLQHLLVLALRLAFVAMLVLLFCQPFIPAAQQASLPDSAVNVVVDNSPSMGTETTAGPPLLEQATTELRRISQVLPKTVQYRLWRGNVPQKALSAQMLEENLAALEIAAGSNGVQDRLQRLINQPRYSGQPTFIVSDFQRANFGTEQLKQLRPAGEVYLLPMAAKSTANVYVDSVYLTEGFVQAGITLPLQVRLRNGGDRDAAVQVRVLVGPRQVGAYQATIPAGNSVINAVQVRLDGTQTQRCRVEIDDQPVAFDNVYYFTLTPAGRIRVQDIAVEASATQKLYPNEATFAYSKGTPVNLVGGLTGVDMLILQGDSRLGAAQRASVQQFAQQGGTVVVVPPGNAGLRSDYEQLFADLGLAAVRWTGAGNTALQELALPNQQNPFFKDVFAERSRQPDMPRATPVLTWSRSTTDVLKFRDGQPFLSGFRTGTGMVYVFASPWRTGFSTFADHPLFVPVMYRLATLSKTTEQLPAYRLTDRSVMLRQPAGPVGGREQVYKLRTDSTAFVPAQQVRAGRLYLQLPPELRQPGFYQLVRADQPLATLAFNVDKRESELARFSAEELRELTAAYPNVHVYEAGGDRSAAAQFAEERAGTPLWRYCLLGALACLLGEVLVLRFGRRSEPTLAQAA